MFITGLVVLFCLASASVNGAPIRALALQRFQGDFGLGLDYDEESRDNLLLTSSGKTGGRDTSFFEALNLNLGGYIYHPRLVQFKIDTELRLEQGEAKQRGGSSQGQDSTFANYAIFSHVLKEHQVSLQFGANRQKTDNRQSFIGRRTLVSSREFTSLSYANEVLPTVVTYSTSHFKGEEGDPTNDSTENVTLEMQNFGKFGESRLIIENVDSSQETQQRRLRTNLAEFHHGYQFGKGERNRLTTSFRFSDQDGTDEYRNFSANHHLLSQLNDSLQGRYFFQYIESQSPGQGSGSLDSSASLHHQLYNSMKTSLEVHGRRSRFGSGREKSLGGQYGVKYNKILPFGLLNLGYQALAEDKAENFSGEPILILREPHSFGENSEGEEVIILIRDFVDPQDIRLSDEDGFDLIDPDTGFPIVEGIHYTVETGEVVTRIRLLLPGFFLRESDGFTESVFVTYFFEPPPPLEYAVFSHSFSTSFSLLDTWKFFYSASRSKQNLDSGINQGQLEDTSGETFGLDLTYLATVSRFEKEVRNSVKTPLDRVMVTESISIPLHTSPYIRKILRFEGSYSESKTFPGIKKTYGRDLLASLSLQGYRMESLVLASYSNDDLLGEDQDTFGLRADLGWRIRTLKFLFSYEYLLRKREFSGDETDIELMMKVSRNFRIF